MITTEQANAATFEQRVAERIEQVVSEHPVALVRDQLLCKCGLFFKTDREYAKHVASIAAAGVAEEAAKVVEALPDEEGKWFKTTDRNLHQSSVVAAFRGGK